jgi:peptidylprolyl isomerase
MKRNVVIFSLCALSAFSSLTAEETPAVETKAPVAEVIEAPAVDIVKISQAFGHVIGKNLETIGVKFDMAQVIKGLQDAIAGKDSPMTEMECIQAISAAQENVFKQQCAENLKRAESFLSDNGKTEGMVAIEEGKVQYKIVEQGKGDALGEHDSPLIKYCGKYLDGSVFGASKEEETISLDEVIPGLRAGLIGMREGEKRTVYIHPDLAYGTNGYLPPNSLLTFEVEIVKNKAPVVQETVEAATPNAVPPQEIADSKPDVR